MTDQPHDTDLFELWLLATIASQHSACVKEAERYGGKPGTINLAPQAMRYELEAYEFCLEKYKVYKQGRTP